MKDTGQSKLRSNWAYTIRSKPATAKVRISGMGKAVGLAVYRVDAEKVRDEVDIDFTQGGHPAVYGYIPRGEVWIESTLSNREAAIVLLHELVEYELMREGLSYSKAHDKACAVEHRLRQTLGHESLTANDIVKVAALAYSCWASTHTKR